MAQNMPLDHIFLAQLRRPLRPLPALTLMCLLKLTHSLVNGFNTLTCDYRILSCHGPILLAHFLVLADRNFCLQSVGAMTCDSLLPDVPISSDVLESTEENGSLTELCVLLFYESKHVRFAVTVFFLP